MIRKDILKAVTKSLHLINALQIVMTAEMEVHARPVNQVISSIITNAIQLAQKKHFLHQIHVYNAILAAKHVQGHQVTNALLAHQERFYGMDSVYHQEL